MQLPSVRHHKLPRLKWLVELGGTAALVDMMVVIGACFANGCQEWDCDAPSEGSWSSQMHVEDANPGQGQGLARSPVNSATRAWLFWD